MPELPDVAVLTEAFHAALAGREVVGVSAPESLVVRGTPVELEAIVGQGVRSIRRRGKFLAVGLDTDRIIVNPMLTGRLGLAPPGAKAWASTAFTLILGSRTMPPADAAGWTDGAGWMPLDSDAVELRYRDPTRMGKVYLLPAGVPRIVAGWDELGPDADDPELDLATWNARIRRHRGEAKGILRTQSFVAGLGNGYSDEILWAAGLAPFRVAPPRTAGDIPKPQPDRRRPRIMRPGSIGPRS